MGIYGSSHPLPNEYRETLETLKEQLYSLNMRLRLSLQNHDEEMRIALEQEISDLKKQIDDMKFGR
jgi:hypothetical protein